MKIISLVVGLVLFVIGLGLSTHLAWSNPDMTNRRLALNFPGEVFGSIFLVILGFFCIGYSTTRKNK